MESEGLICVCVLSQQFVFAAIKLVSDCYSFTLQMGDKGLSNSEHETLHSSVVISHLITLIKCQSESPEMERRSSIRLRVFIRCDLSLEE